MSDERPYSKVTIVIEQGDETTTIRIPVAQDVVLDYSSVPVHTTALDRIAYTSGLIDLGLLMRVLANQETGRYYTVERKPRE